jgi:predicted ABC-type transport system involved in lysophospholipase L1 biosynthesis ATPase subunit
VATFQGITLISEKTIWKTYYIPAVCLAKETISAAGWNILETVGMGERLTHYPNEVSGR